MNRFRMNICTAMDDNYAKYTYVMLSSLFANNKDAEIYVYILQDSLSEESVNRLTEICNKYNNHINIFNMDANSIDKKLSSIGGWGKEASFRLKMLDLLPEEVDRILYLDVDMIINKSLKELYSTDFGDNELVAAIDMPMVNGKTEMYKQFWPPEFDIFFDEECYFNSGMILFNVAKMRGEYTFERYVGLAKELDYHIYAPDQDLLNMMHKDKVFFVDSWKYNFFAGIGIDKGYDYDRTKQEVAIIHFAGKKPWKGGDHVHFSIEKIWWDYALDSPYRDQFLSEYALESIMDGTVRDYVRDLLEQNGNLRNDLNSAVESFNKLYDAYRGAQ